MAQYQVTAVWWPDGWEPCGPLDVPNCVAHASASDLSNPVMSYPRALATARSLNRQNMDRPSTVWYVVAEVGEPATPEGAQALHVVRPTEGSSSGDCSHCPASSFPCATQQV